MVSWLRPAAACARSGMGDLSGSSVGGDVGSNVGGNIGGLPLEWAYCVCVFRLRPAAARAHGGVGSLGGSGMGGFPFCKLVLI